MDFFSFSFFEEHFEEKKTFTKYFHQLSKLDQGDAKLYMITLCATLRREPYVLFDGWQNVLPPSDQTPNFSSRVVGEDVKSLNTRKTN